MRALLVVLLLMLVPLQAAAHLPPGYKLRLVEQLGDYELRVVVVPSKPVVNESFEVIVGAVNTRTSEPFRGVVLINGTPAERFSMAFYEVRLRVEEGGNYTLPVELVAGEQRMGLNLSVEVVERRNRWLLVPAIILLLLFAVLTAVWVLRRQRV
ncbi:MAG: hypothetical protein GXN98_03800 [Euryarchaeota archaeon]|nr:hypothetical protein [Euryarchaeota archaeon]